MYSEIQKNSSIFSNLTETMQIIDKRKKQVLAMAYPVQNVSVVDKLAEKDRKSIKPTERDLERIKESAMQIAMEQKYGLSS